jgi:hypothetical protein
MVVCASVPGFRHPGVAMYLGKTLFAQAYPEDILARAATNPDRRLSVAALSRTPDVRCQPRASVVPYRPATTSLWWSTLEARLGSCLTSRICATADNAASRPGQRICRVVCLLRFNQDLRHYMMDASLAEYRICRICPCADIENAARFMGPVAPAIIGVIPLSMVATGAYSVPLIVVSVSAT